jgi:putative ABC transport system substrate-binding protein
MNDFISPISGAAASPLVAGAQHPAKMKRIALVNPADKLENMVASAFPFYRVFFDEISRVGFVEGKNLVVERYTAGGDTNRFPELVRDVLDTRPDAIYPLEFALTYLFKLTNSSIPIVSIVVDPVATGLAKSIARPGGNITGVVVDAGPKIWGKRFGLLKELLPKLSKLALILPVPPKSWEVSPYWAIIRQTAKTVDVELLPALLDGKIDEAAYQRVFAMFDENRPDALLIAESPINAVNSSTIIELAAKYRLPAMYTWKEIAEIGGLMSYSFDLEELGRYSGYQMGQILNGTNPADIPFIQVTRLYLTLNLKTAKSLGIEFPATLLGSADFIIE